MKNIFLKTFKWILLTIVASVITVIVQGIVEEQNRFNASAEAYFSYEKLSEEEIDGMYRTEFLLILRGFAPLADTLQTFVYPGRYCSVPEIRPEDLENEWHYVSVCTTDLPIAERGALFQIVQVAR
ncbi:hypothetical protein KTR10_02105 [Candidatus Kaiserbacteria bacterium]|nr:hypothetical protein [Candidatus Kaiserbacteria bacterium]